jgi:hypothetical protein
MRKSRLTHPPPRALNFVQENSDTDRTTSCFTAGAGGPTSS